MINNLKKISYSRKQYVFVVLLVFAMLVIYKLAFSRTIGVIQKSRRIENQLSQIDNSGSVIKQLETTLLKQDERIGNKSESINKRSVIIENLTRYCSDNQINIVKIHQPIIQMEAKYEIEYTTITLQSSYKKLMLLLKSLENDSQQGNLIHCKFQVEKNRRSGQEFLNLSIYYQNISK